MGTTRQDLYLQVNASLDPFTRAMRAGKPILREFAGDVDGMVDAINASLAEMGGDQAASAARAMENSFRRSFSAIQDSAREALKLPSNDNGALNLNVQGAQRAAQAAETQAIALREVATAAVAAAAASETDDAALRVYAASATSAAAAAEEYAVGLRNQANTLGAVQDQLDAAGATAAHTGDIVTGAHTRMSASGMIMQHVVRSSADSFVAGMSPAQIFAEQIGRLSEAATFLGPEMGKVGEFLAGPWGIAISAAVAVASVLVTKLLDMHDAAEAAKIGNDGLSDAQSVLGKMFDLTSGKLEHQNELLRLNAELTAVNLRAEAAKERESSSATTDKLGTSTWTNYFLPQYIGGEIGAAPKQLMLMVQENLNDPTHKAGITPEEAVKRSQTVDMMGSTITRDQFRQAIVDATSSIFKDQTADKIEKTLASGNLDPDFKRDRKPKVDHSGERDANKDEAYSNKLRAADDALLKARLQLAGTADAQYQIKLIEIASDESLKDQAVQDEVTAKKISDKQAKILIGKNKELADQQRQAALRDKTSQELEETFQADQHARDARDELLRLDLALATTREARLGFERRLLADEQASRRAALQNIASDPKSTPAQKKQAETDVAQLGPVEDAENKSLTDRYLSPLGNYFKQMKQDADDALENVEVDGLKGLEDGLVGIIDGTKSVASAFKDMTGQIISDLARIFIEKEIVGPLAGFLFPGHADGGAIQAHAGGGTIRGKGGPRSDSILSWLSNGEFVVNAASASKHLPLLKAINDNHLPGFADGGFIGADLSQMGVRHLSRSAMREVSARPQPIMYVDLSNSFVDSALWDKVNAIASQHARGAEIRATAAGAKLGSAQVVAAAGRTLR